MIQDLKQAEYQRGMIESSMNPNDLPVKTWHGTGIPAEVRTSINDEGILNLGGVYGDQDVGDPVEYEHLRLAQTSDVVEIKILNRRIALLMIEDEKMRRIHRVLCKVDERKE